MTLTLLQKNWEALAATDPLWAILTLKKGDTWNVDDFFATGEMEILKVMRFIARHSFLKKKKRALDFGCGVGRLTQNIAKYFQDTHGVDISSPMITLANEYNETFKKKRNRKRTCTFHVNTSLDLKMFPNNYFDFIYSSRTLQHMKPMYMKMYIKEFVRILSPRGLLLFQLPSEPARNIKGNIIRLVPSKILDTVRGSRLKGLLFSLFGCTVVRMEMHGIKRESLEHFLMAQKLNILDVQPDGTAGDGWVSFSYYLSKAK